MRRATLALILRSHPLVSHFSSLRILKSSFSLAHLLYVGIEFLPGLPFFVLKLIDLGELAASKPVIFPVDAV